MRGAAPGDLPVPAYCLMPNHIHGIAVPREVPDLATVMQRAHGRYPQYLNARRGRCGPLWQNRFHSCPLGASHLWAALRILFVQAWWRARDPMNGRARKRIYREKIPGGSRTCSFGERRVVLRPGRAFWVSLKRPGSGRRYDLRRTPGNRLGMKPLPEKCERSARWCGRRPPGRLPQMAASRDCGQDPEGRRSSGLSDRKCAQYRRAPCGNIAGES